MKTTLFLLTLLLLVACSPSNDGAEVPDPPCWMHNTLPTEGPLSEHPLCVLCGSEDLDTHITHVLSHGKRKAECDRNPNHPLESWDCYPTESQCKVTYPKKFPGDCYYFNGFEEPVVEGPYINAGGTCVPCGGGHDMHGNECDPEYESDCKVSRRINKEECDIGDEYAIGCYPTWQVCRDNTWQLVLEDESYANLASGY